MQGMPASKIAAEVGCSTGNVSGIRKTMEREGLVLPIPVQPPGNRLFFRTRWQGRTQTTKHGYRRRHIKARHTFIHAGATWTSCNVDDSHLLGPTLRTEQEHILYRIRSVDDTSGDWRSEAT